MGANSSYGILDQFLRNDVSWYWTNKNDMGMESVFVTSDATSKGNVCWEQGQSLGVMTA